MTKKQATIKTRELYLVKREDFVYLLISYILYNRNFSFAFITCYGLWNIYPLLILIQRPKTTIKISQMKNEAFLLLETSVLQHWPTMHNNTSITSHWCAWWAIFFTFNFISTNFWTGDSSCKGDLNHALDLFCLICLEAVFVSRKCFILVKFQVLKDILIIKLTIIDQSSHLF